MKMRFQVGTYVGRSVDMSGFVSLMKKHKIKEATDLIDRLQMAYPDDLLVQEYFIMLFTAQRRDSEVVSRTSGYLTIPDSQQMIEISTIALAMAQQRVPIACSPPSCNPNLFVGVPESGRRLILAYDYIMSHRTTDWVRFGILDRVLKDDPTNPSAICLLFGRMTDKEKLSTMKGFPLTRLEDAMKRGAPNSNQHVLNHLLEIKRILIKNPNFIPFDWTYQSSVVIGSP